MDSNCGRFNVTNNASFDILDRASQNEYLAKVVASDSQQKIQSINVKTGCETIFCAPDLLNSTKQTRFCDRFTEFADISAYKYFHADVASCSCKKPSSDCNQTKCEDVILDEDVCAQFYKESNCTLCHYDKPYKLTRNQTINPTNNSFSVDSMIVKENCMLEITSFGIPVAYYKGGSYNTIQLAYTQKIKPAQFNCACGNTTGKDSTKILIGLASLALIVLLLGSIAIGFKYYRVRQKLLKYSNEAIKRFTDGTIMVGSNSNISGPQYNIGFEDEDDYSVSRSHYYISTGYLEALQQPYSFQYEVPRDNLTVYEKASLGEGNFGKVCLGKLFKDNGQTKVEVAVKIAKGSTNVIYFVSLLDEIKILSFLGSHPNIVCIVGTCTENINQRDVLLLLEMCSKGNLKNYVCCNRASFLEDIPCSAMGMELGASCSYQSWSVMMPTKPTKIRIESFVQLLKWSQEIANGMEYLSSKNVIHIDLAARNVLLSADLTAKVSDFGLSRRIQASGNYAKVGDDYGLPISWMAMESLRDQRFTTESDIWSYGVVLWELFSLGDEPYRKIPMEFTELQNFLNQGRRLEKPEHATDEIYSEMCKCWTSEPSDRPSFNELKLFFNKGA